MSTNYQFKLRKVASQDFFKEKIQPREEATVLNDDLDFDETQAAVPDERQPVKPYEI